VISLVLKQTDYLLDVARRGINQGIHQTGHGSDAVLKRVLGGTEQVGQYLDVINSLQNNTPINKK
jgi:hypothetical protein